MNSELSERIRCKELLTKVVEADEAVDCIKRGMSVGISSDLVPICRALERKAKRDRDFRISLWSGVYEVKADHTLGDLGAIERRIGQQTVLRKSINAKHVEYMDTRLGFFYQGIRSGLLGPLDVAIVEAVGITEQGNLIPSYRLADMPNFVQAARHVIVQLNTYYPLEMEGLHDIYIPGLPPYKGIIPITKVDERIGTPHIHVDPEKIRYIVPSKLPESIGADGQVDEISKKISENLMGFFRREVSGHRLPPNLLPIEIGLGRIPRAILEDLKHSQFQDLEFYSAILNDQILDLIDQGKIRAATGSGLYLSSQGEQKFLRNLHQYKKHIVIRPVEITDCPEVIARLGLLALNGAIEVDIYGHANSSHIMNGDVVSGVGGVSEFAMNAYMSVILLPSTAKSGNISSIVPMVSHVDIPEHGVDVVVTEQGLADLRGTPPLGRAEKIIDCCSHPRYRPLLREYFERAKKEGGGHEPHLLEQAFSFHERFLNNGSMDK